jgi:hypothetical protein
MHEQRVERMQKRMIHAIESITSAATARWPIDQDLCALAPGEISDPPAQ